MFDTALPDNVSAPPSALLTGAVSADRSEVPDLAGWATGLAPKDLERELRSTSAELAAGTYRLLVLVAEFDRRDAAEDWECRSTAHWLSWQCGIGPTAAREQVRVARRLEDLPLTSAALAEGRISYSKVRAITRVAVPESEADLLDLANASTAGQLDRICAAIRRYGSPQDEEAQLREQELGADDRAFVTWQRNEHGDLVGSFCLPAETGEAFVRAVRAADDGDPTVTGGCRRARAVHRMAAGLLATPDDRAGQYGTGGQLDRGVGVQHRRPQPEIVVHVDLLALGRLAGAVPESADLGDRTAVSRTSTGAKVSAAALSRLVGDAGLRYVADLADGTQLDLGRHQRTVTPALFRALKSRDRHCQFPGCDSSVQLHAHHITWWSRGGRTSPDNLLLLCRKHHHAVHDREWTCEGTATSPTFTRPDGSAVTNANRLPGASAEALRSTNRRWSPFIADSPGGEWAGDQVEWGWLFAGLVHYLPTIQRPVDGPSGGPDSVERLAA